MVKDKKITLLGEPLSTQNIYRYVCRGKFGTFYMDKRGQDLKKSYYFQAKSQYKGKPLVKELGISVTLFHKTKRRCDWDNFHKLSMDSLTGIVWADDSQIKEAFIKQDYDKDSPRIELTIYEL